MVQRLELDEGAHRMLMEHCRSRNIEFLSTPFDTDSVDLLVRELDLRCIKIPSGEITNGPYLLHIAETGRPVILSTGMSSLAEIETALSVLAFGYLSGRAEPSLENFVPPIAQRTGRPFCRKESLSSTARRNIPHLLRRPT
jgi:N-acetylneuraminate synthase